MGIFKDAMNRIDAQKTASFASEQKYKTEMQQHTKAAEAAKIQLEQKAKDTDQKIQDLGNTVGKVFTTIHQGVVDTAASVETRVNSTMVEYDAKIANMAAENTKLHNIIEDMQRVANTATTDHHNALKTVGDDSVKSGTEILDHLHNA